MEHIVNYNFIQTLVHFVYVYFPFVVDRLFCKGNEDFLTAKTLKIGNDENL